MKHLNSDELRIAAEIRQSPTTHLKRALTEKDATALKCFDDEDLSSAVITLCQEFRTADNPHLFLQLINWLQVVRPSQIESLLQDLPTQEIHYWLKIGETTHLNLLRTVFCENLEAEIDSLDYAVIVDAVYENRLTTLNWINQNFPGLMDTFVTKKLSDVELSQRINSSDCTDEIRLFFLKIPRYFECAERNPTTLQYIKNKLDVLKRKMAEHSASSEEKRTEKRFDIVDVKTSLIYYYVLHHLIEYNNEECNDDIRLLLKIPSIHARVFPRMGNSDLIELCWNKSNFSGLALLCENKESTRFNDCDLGSKSLEHFNLGLQCSSQRASKLYLKNNKFHKLAGADLGKRFSLIPSNIIYLSLDGNALGEMTVSDFSKALSGLPQTIRYLSLKNCSIDQLAKKDLSQLSIRLENIEGLELSDTEFEKLSQNEKDIFLNMFPNAVFFTTKTHSMSPRFFDSHQKDKGPAQVFSTFESPRNS